MQHLLTSTGDAANRLLQHTLTVASPLLENTLSTLASVMPAARTTLVAHASMKLDATPAVARLRTASSSVASFVSRRRAVAAAAPGAEAGLGMHSRPGAGMQARGSAFATPRAQAGLQATVPVAAPARRVAAEQGPTAADAAVPAAEEGWVAVSRPDSADEQEQGVGAAAEGASLEQSGLLGQLRPDDLSPLDQQHVSGRLDVAAKAQDAGLRQRHAGQQGH